MFKENATILKKIKSNFNAKIYWAKMPQIKFQYERKKEKKYSYIYVGEKAPKEEENT